MIKLTHSEISKFANHDNLYLRQEIWGNQSWGASIVVLDDAEVSQLAARNQFVDQHGVMDYAPCRYTKISEEDKQEGILEYYWET